MLKINYILYYNMRALKYKTLPNRAIKNKNIGTSTTPLLNHISQYHIHQQVI